MPSTEVALFHMSEVVRSVASPVADEDEEWEVVRSVASPVGDEDEERRDTGLGSAAAGPIAVFASAADGCAVSDFCSSETDDSTE